MRLNGTITITGYTVKTITLLQPGAIPVRAAPVGHAEPAPAFDPAGRYAQGELLVKWKDGQAGNAGALGSASGGATVKRNFSAVGWQRVMLPEGMSVSEGLEAYRR